MFICPISQGKMKSYNYVERLAELGAIVEGINTTCVYVVGNFDADLSKRCSMFGGYLHTFCEVFFYQLIIMPSIYVN